MTNKLLSIIKYILSNYPHPDELSASRLTKMVYLADWKEAINNGKQLTNIVWFFNHHGPYNDEILQEAKKDKDINITIKNNMFGGKKTHIEICNNSKTTDLDEEDYRLLDFVINATKDKNYTDFIKLIYSTYPVISSEKYTKLDLINKAEEYKKLS
jgi:hypothetical protein